MATIKQKHYEIRADYSGCTIHRQRHSDPCRSSGSKCSVSSTSKPLIIDSTTTSNRCKITSTLLCRHFDRIFPRLNVWKFQLSKVLLATFEYCFILSHQLQSHSISQQIVPVLAQLDCKESFILRRHQISQLEMERKPLFGLSYGHSWGRLDAS